MMKNFLIATLIVSSSIISTYGNKSIEENNFFSLKSQYFFNSFVQGEIHFKNGVMSNGELNYNVLVGEFHYIEDGILKTFSDFDLKRISKLIMNNRQFVIKKNTIYEIIYADKMILLNKRTPIQKDTNQNEGAYGTSSSTSTNKKLTTLSHAIGHEMEKGAIVNLKDELNNLEIKIEESFYILFNSEVHNANKKSFYAIYPDHKEDIKAYIKKEKIKFKTSDDIIKLIDYCKAF